MLYVESRKFFEVESGKKFNSLPSVKKHSANHNLCRVPKIILDKEIFAECKKIHSANIYLCRVPKIVHSAKNCLPSVFILPSVFCGTLGKDLIY